MDSWTISHGLTTREVLKLIFFAYNFRPWIIYITFHREPKLMYLNCLPPVSCWVAVLNPSFNFESVVQIWTSSCKLNDITQILYIRSCVGFFKEEKLCHDILTKRVQSIVWIKIICPRYVFNLRPNFMNWTDVSLTTSCNSLNFVPHILQIFDFLKPVLTSTAFLKKNMVDCGQYHL